MDAPLRLGFGRPRGGRHPRRVNLTAREVVAVSDSDQEKKPPQEPPEARPAPSISIAVHCQVRGKEKEERATGNRIIRDKE